ncbi:MAG: stage V sporulation protein AD [Syntrophomonadaceae bacterium]|jgi:stage V sporulation protein AD
MPQAKKKGKQTVSFDKPPVLSSWASIVGPKEGQGPWGNDFDLIMPDYLMGEDTWEKAENKMLKETIELALNKSGLNTQDAEVLLAGDLLNQLVSANFAASQLNIPFLGLYGACSTMVESILIGSMLIDGGFFERVVAAACSHHYTAERQYRFPTEQGVQKPPSSQWTTTAAGAVVLEGMGSGPRITCATIGRVVDMGQTDTNDMGSAMAPAAVDTIKMHFNDLNRPFDYYDLVVTGDLGKVGMAILGQLFIKEGIVPQPVYSDCGVILYDDAQDIGSGGSGCGCCASMLCGPLLKKMFKAEIKKLLLVATGALMSPTTSFQGRTIPAIAHAVAIEY